MASFPQAWQVGSLHLEFVSDHTGPNTRRNTFASVAADRVVGQLGHLPHYVRDFELRPKRA